MPTREHITHQERQSLVRSHEKEIMKPAQPYQPSKLPWVLRGAGLVGILLITVTIAAHRDHLQEFSTLGYAGAFLAMLVGNATLVLPAPGLIIVFVLGSTLNPLVVGVTAALGAALGEMTGYFTGYAGLALVENYWVALRIRGWMNRNGLLTIFALSAIPNPFFDLAGLMAGAGRMPVWKFLSVAFLGKGVQATCVALAGALSLEWVEQLLQH